ncbi:uncharacterized protein OGAPODRAFT_16343 [Ogataea polymorpha]|uniref:uncharacterized protein n=1 Tax=Ogataea polymorpha TaxID=460523 RepID=UPI0007F5108A|nr:uncharacterized protein OGAPODRAFT_16343 [Ogataea polymorpha]OBA16858.1 hypothetical protein OGAPODRAFT_16343 [Ogataea polymorpha]
MKKLLSRKDKRHSVISPPSVSSNGSPTLTDAHEPRRDDDRSDSTLDLNSRSAPRTASLEATKRNLLKGLSAKRSTASLAPSGVQNLVDPSWDSEVLKVGWLNKLSDADDADDVRLCRAEVKGSTLLVYRPPAELRDVKCFDLEKKSSARAAADVAPQRSVVSGVDEDQAFSEERSRSHKAMPQINLPSDFAGSQLSIATSLSSLNVKLDYASVRYPHPDLKLEDETGEIVDGTVEALCHAVIFNPNSKVSKQLVQILPLVENVATALQYFHKYSELMEQTEKNSSNKYLMDHNNRMVVWASRLYLVVDMIRESFPGLLLDEEVLKGIWNLLVCVDRYRDCDSLKIAIHQQQQQLQKLLPLGTGQLSDLDATVFLETRLDVLAAEINAMHQRYAAAWAPDNDPSLLYETAMDNHAHWRANPLIFTLPDNLHYLARLLCYHLFDDAHVTTPTQRAQLLGKWIQLGSTLSSMGDMVGWLAIATVVCSMPVLRLARTWDHVLPEYVQLVSSNWAPVVFELDRRSIVSSASHRASYHVLAPQGIGRMYARENVVPYFGDLLVKKASCTLRDHQRHVSRVRASFAKWEQFLAGVHNEPGLSKKHAHVGSLDAVVAGRLSKVLQCHVRGLPLSLSALMEQSLRVEPAHAGQFHRLHDTSRSPLFLGSYAALMFPETLERDRIFDRSSLLGAIGGGDTAQPALSSTLAATDNDELKKISRNQFVKTVRDVFNVDSHDFHVDDDSIVFKTNDTRGIQKKSRPSSALLGESASVKRYSSYSSNSFSLDEYFNTYQAYVEGREKETEKVSAEILTKAATLDRLLDLLVLTYSTFGARIAEEDIKRFVGNAPADCVELKMNNGVFTMTFFAVYRGFCSTTTLLQGLKKRFIGAKAAARSIAEGSEPDWDASFSGKYADTNWIYVGQIQLGVLETLQILVENCYHHFTDNLENKTIFDSLLRHIDNETIVQWNKVLLWLEAEESSDQESLQQVRQLYDSLTATYKSMRKSYVRKSYRPVLNRRVPTFTTELTIVPADRLLPRSKDIATIEKFVLDLDATIGALYGLSTLDDWIAAFEILETHACTGPLSLSQYDAQPADVPDTELVVANIYNWLATMKDAGGEYVVNKFPAPVRSLFEFYFRLKTYFAAQILDRNLVEPERIDRMRVAALMLGKTRSGETLRVPGMLESCLTDVILLPESRRYADCWRKLAKTDSLDSLEQLIPQTTTVKVLPCPGWLAERMLEIACFIPNKAVENTNLINFDKRRFAYNCVSNILDLVPPTTDLPQNTPFAFLFSCSCAQPAPRELPEAGSSVFGHHLQQQRQLLLIETARRRLLVRQLQKWTAPQEPYRDYRRESVRVSRSIPMRPAGSSGSSMFKLGGLLKNRAFSISMGHGERVVGVDDLGVADDFVDAKQRPVILVNLRDYTIFPVYQAPCSFKLSSATQELVFQAVSEAEKDDWLYQINFARKHWYWSRTVNKYTHHNFVFGVPLDYVCEREGRQIPAIIEKMMSEIEFRGLEETGLYRKSASVSVLNEIRDVINLHGDLNMEDQLVFDVHNLTGVIKMFFRELPEPLILDTIIPEFDKIKQLAQSEERFEQYKLIFDTLPAPNRTLLARFVKHLKMVDEYNRHNRMPASNLAKVMGGLFIEGCRPENNKYFGLMTFVCEDLIVHYDHVWS